MKRIFATVLASALGVSGAWAQEMKLAVTASFQNSGLGDILLPAIKEDLGIEVQLLVVDTGQAVKLGEAGEVDAILVHSRPAEDEFLANGHGTHRREIMYSDFVFIGPGGDPADVKFAAGATDVLTRIANTKAPFVSRGDDSGTHEKELSLWKTADLDAAGFGDWYHNVGADLGTALDAASGMDAYIIADRASWLNFANKGGLELLYYGDPVLFNQYAFVPVNPEKHPHVRNDLANKLEEWLVADRARGLINDYEINGETLFVFNAVAAQAVQ